MKFSIDQIKQITEKNKICLITDDFNMDDYFISVDKLTTLLIEEQNKKYRMMDPNRETILIKSLVFADEVYDVIPLETYYKRPNLFKSYFTKSELDLIKDRYGMKKKLETCTAFEIINGKNHNEN